MNRLITEFLAIILALMFSHCSHRGGTTHGQKSGTEFKTTRHYPHLQG